MASTPAFGSMDPLGLFRQAGGKRPDRQPAPTPARQPDYDAASVIRDFEGFKDKPYWDVNALRAGYGSDTITSADGVVRRVAAGDVVSREDADRDLARRIDTEFVPSIVKEVGQDAWDALPGPTKAALSSVTYNYGNLPDSVAAAVKTGDGEAIAAAVEGLRGHNNGVNAKRRAKEAAMIRGGASAGADGAIVVDASYRPRDPMNLWRRPGGERRDDGMLEQGNIDLSSRPIRDNGDGTKSTVRSMSFGEDGVEVLIPTIGPDGRALTDDEAIARYHKTGEFLGKFASPEAATSFAEQLHEQQAEFLAQAESAGTKALFDKLDAESPGRYQVVDESELEGWQGDWKKKNASDGILGDTWRLLGMGQVGVEASMRELVRQIPYVGQHLVDAGDGIDKWVYGKASDDRYADLYAKDEATLTPEMRAARQKSWWDEDRGTLGDAWMDPRAYFAGVVESLPGTVATMAPAMFLARGAYLASLATGGTTKAAAAAAARTAMISGAVLEGGMGGADTARGVRAQIEAMPREQLLQTQAVQTLVDQGMTPDEAIAAVTNDAATQAFIVAGAATGMFGGFGDRMLAKIIGEGVEGTIGKRIAAGIGRGMVAEGLLEEAPQSAGGQLANNLALRNTVDPSQDLGEGVADAALGGAAVGAVMGGTLGGGGAAARPAQDGAVAEPAAPAPAPPAPPAPAPKKGPLVTALQAGVVASQQAGGVPDLSTLVAPEDLTPRGPDMVVEPPPDDAVTMVPVDIAGYPSPGATVRVEAEGIEPFTGKVDSYDQSDDGLEVVVISPDGQVLQVPTSAVKVPRVDQSVVAQLDAARNPPVDRSDVETDDATTRTVNGRTIVMPDEGLARLYDVGKERQISQRISGASGLQMRDAQVGQEKEVADLLGVLPDRIPEIADDYRYRVEKASRAKRDSDLPFQMHGLNADRLKGWKGRARRVRSRADRRPREHRRLGAVVGSGS
jgi:GH24 family phage-related lysozyme (muramidase)